MALDISKASDKVWQAGLVHKLKSYGISGQIFGLICSFLCNRWLQVVLDENLHKNIQLMLEFLKAPFLALHFCYYTLMTFLTILSVILLSMRMIILSILTVIRHQICGKNLSWLLNLNLIYETLWTGVRSSLLISMLGKTLSFDRSNNNGSIDVEMDGSILKEKSPFKMLGLTFYSKLEWGS